LLSLNLIGQSKLKGNIMRKITYSIEPLINLFHKEKVLNLEQIKAALGSDVKMTAFRKLKLLTYKASYSHAGKYYTLDEIALFNNYGIWQYHHIYFSKFGTLKNTIEQLVCSSEAGYTALELEQLLNVRVFKPLFQLYSTGRLYREQIGDSYVYGSANNYEFQKKSRIEQLEFCLKKKIVEQSLGFDNAEIKESLHVLLSSLNEKQRRLYVGFESLKLGYGGDSIMSHITGMNIKTIGKGRKELQSKGITPDRVRKQGGGRRALKKNRSYKDN